MSHLNITTQFNVHIPNHIVNVRKGYSVTDKAAGERNLPLMKMGLFMLVKNK